MTQMAHRNTGRKFGPVPKRWIGFFGCANADRVVAVNSRPLVCIKPFHAWSWELTCPACGETHVVKPLWREATEYEQRTRGEAQVPKEFIDPNARAAAKKGLKLHNPHGHARQMGRNW